ncbi:hypothetical protein CTU88_39940 [Streptomyces sp. JV178]|nr:hypothetical protein CTU88_39940 [Streptomyces sp. JV178]
MVALDSAIVRAHPHRRQKGLEERGLGRSRGLTSKIRLACDGRGRPLTFTVTPRHPQRLQTGRSRRLKATIPGDQLAGRARRRELRCNFDKAVYPRRNAVERCFHRLKQRRGIASHHDKQPGRYRDAITLASTFI